MSLFSRVKSPLASYVFMTQATQFQVWQIRTNCGIFWKKMYYKVTILAMNYDKYSVNKCKQFCFLEIGFRFYDFSLNTPNRKTFIFLFKCCDLTMTVVLKKLSVDRSESRLWPMVIDMVDTTPADKPWLIQDESKKVTKTVILLLY